MTEIHRYPNVDELADGVATALLRAVIALQAGDRIATVALTGGRTATSVYARLGARVRGSELDPGRLELWWSDEGFVPTDDPQRNAGPTLALLAGHFPLDPARTHSMPAADGVADNAASAATYAKELGSTVFDICLLALGADGSLAAIFPNHPSFEPNQHRVIAVNDAPKPPAERISVSMETIKAAGEVWIIASGMEKAAILPRVLAGDDTLPAGVARGAHKTVWFLDAAAAARLDYFDCAF